MVLVQKKVWIIVLFFVLAIWFELRKSAIKIIERGIPFVLNKDIDEREVKGLFYCGYYLTGDGVEDIAMVKIPALIAQLVRTSLHQAYHVVPENNFVSWGEGKSMFLIITW